MKNNKKDILSFWFEDTKPQQWFQKSEAFDSLIRDNFLEIYESAKDGLLQDWEKDADGCLALCILLDQFPRNMFRGSAKAFETDQAALLIAKKAINKGFDQILEPVKRRFLYLPFEHSENMSDQKRSMELFEKVKNEDPMGYEYAHRHFTIIDRYNRFPHRNAILGRTNTPEEELYLSKQGSGF